MQLHFWRHATFVLSIGSLKLLVDPMLSPAGAMNPVGNAANDRRIPLVDLPFPESVLHENLNKLDAVLVTHLHRDHWDAAAVEWIPRTLPVFCQPGDETTIASSGFTSVTPVVADIAWRGLHLTRTGGHHGTGELAAQMGNVSGFILQSTGEPLLYIAGDTVWCAEVEAVLNNFRPHRVILNTGEARFLTGDPITMGVEDVVQVCRAAPQARVIAVHMETINHCLLTRVALRDQLQQRGFLDQVAIPADGELVTL
ncbi:MAG: MBL fold metallo-hydrolase [Anaerolineae bacterium]|nr:MBL fold metallo-hydrolase [Anaerolineae bacterium]